jgi:hypothetical protein
MRFFISCETTPEKTYQDNRPIIEKDFIQKLAYADSDYKSQLNDIKRHDVLDSDKTIISQYIINKLKFKVNNWIGFVDDISVHQLDRENFIEANLLIPKDTVLTGDYPQYNAIVLTAGVSIKPNKIKEILKNLVKGDKVNFTGIFLPNGDRIIDFSSNMMVSPDYLFSNPKFDFLIQDIKKI